MDKKEIEKNFQRVQLKIITINNGRHDWVKANQIDDLNKFLGDIPADNIVAINTIIVKGDYTPQQEVYIYYKTPHLEYNLCSLCGGYLERKKKERKPWQYNFRCSECGELFDDKLRHKKQKLNTKGVDM